MVGRAAEHRQQVALDDALAQPVADVLDAQRPGAQELLHQLLVPGRGLLHELGARRLDRRLQPLGYRHLAALLLHAAPAEGVRLVLDQVHDSLEGFRLTDRELDRHGVESETVVEGLDRPGEVRVLLVHHVDDHEGRLPLVAQDVPRDLGADLDPGVRPQDQEGGVGAPERAVDVADEIGVTGAVDQVDFVAGPLELGEAEADRDLPLDLVGGVIEHGRALRDPPEPTGGLGEEQHGLGEGGLPHAVMRDERDVTDLSGAEVLQNAPPHLAWD